MDSAGGGTVMAQWEYQIIVVWTTGLTKDWKIRLADGAEAKGMDEVTAYMNHLGAQGFELVSVLSEGANLFYMFFKRQTD
jgi:hypothetical protein